MAAMLASMRRRPARGSGVFVGWRDYVNGGATAGNGLRKAVAIVIPPGAAYAAPAWPCGVEALDLVPCHCDVD